MEIDCLRSKAITEVLESVAKSKLVKYRIKISEKSTRTRTIWKVTTITPDQQRHFDLVGVKNPASLQDYVWC